MNKYKRISKVLWIILVANLIVAGTKIILGYLLNVNSLSADGFHSLTDSTSNIIGLIGIKFASKPADDEHPYGHQKIETIAGFIIGILLLGISVKIIYNSINWFIHPETPNISYSSLFALLVTLIINIIVAILERRKGIELNSDILIADSIHTKSDTFITTGVIITMVSIKLGVPPIIDPVVSLIIAVFVILSCFEILKTSSNILIDKIIVDKDVIKDIVLNSNNKIIDVHKIKNRGRINDLFIDLHLIVDGAVSVREAHNLSHYIEQVLEDKLKQKVQLNAHIEPDERLK